MDKIIGILQPSYLAWMPFMERIFVSDIFVYLDDVEFSKNNFHNKNRIKTAKGPISLAVPVLHKGNSRAFISDIQIDYKQKWQDKHWKTIEQAYAKTQHFEEIKNNVKDILCTRWSSLGELNIELIEFLRKYIGIDTPCYRSSDIAARGSANEKLIGIIRHFNGTHFLVKPGTEDYHPQEYFAESGIAFKWFDPKPKEYPQLYGRFEPGLSALDFAANCGKNSYRKIHGYENSRV